MNIICSDNNSIRPIIVVKLFFVVLLFICLLSDSVFLSKLLCSAHLMFGRLKNLQMSFLSE